MLRKQEFKTLFLLLAVLVFGGVNNYGQNNESAPPAQERALRDAKYNRVSLKPVLSDFAHLDNIPMSFVFNTKDDRTVSLYVRNATVDDVFDAIVRAKPNYSWERSNNIVRFFPKNIEDSFLQNLFETKITKFSIEPNTLPSAVAARILALREIQTALSKLNTNATAETKDKRDERMLNSDSSLEFNDLTFRELLDKIVKETNAKLWCIEFSAPGEGMYKWIKLEIL